jgi:hypothetical protein
MRNESDHRVVFFPVGEGCHACFVFLQKFYPKTNGFETGFHLPEKLIFRALSFLMHYVWNGHVNAAGKMIL